MKKSPFYSLQTISGIPRLIPYGQAVAAQRRGVQLGGSGALIWSLTDQCGDEDELIRTACSRLGISEDDRSEAEADIRQFIQDLTSLGILEADNIIQKSIGRESRYATLRVGPMRVELRGDEDLFHPDFSRYLIREDDGTAADQTVTVTCCLPPDHAGMICLLQNSELEVYQGDDHIIIRFPTMPDVSACALSPDGTEAVFFVRDTRDTAGKERRREDLFHAIRHAVLYRAQRQGLFVIHSVSVLYRDMVWLFSAPAGTGKSTHAELWRSEFGTPVLNGDLAMLSLSERGPVFHPIPWCGTSGIAMKETHPLGGIAFLRRGQLNSAALLAADDRQLRLANRLISPAWTEDQLLSNLGFAGSFSTRAAMWELTCTREPAAALCMKAAVDQYLEEEQNNG